MKKFIVGVTLFFFCTVAFSQNYSAQVSNGTEHNLQISLPAVFDYSKTIGQIIVEQKSVAEFIPDLTTLRAFEYTPKRVNQIKRTEVVMVYILPTGYSPEEIVSQLKEDGLRPAEVTELLQFGLQYPNIVFSVGEVMALHVSVKGKYPVVGAEATNNLWSFSKELKESTGWYLAVKN